MRHKRYERDGADCANRNDRADLRKAFSAYRKRPGHSMPSARGLSCVFRGQSFEVRGPSPELKTEH